MSKTRGQKLVRVQIIESLVLCGAVILTGLLCSIPSFGITMPVVISAVILLLVVMKLFSIHQLGRVIHWYESLLDAIPFPISVTDNNMKWTFINKPVEGMLGVKRKDKIGKHCSNWGAGICNTSNCGITCLRDGKQRTTFEQMGSDFQVDIAYILDKKGKQVGHIEVVQDISKLLKLQKGQATLFTEINGLCSSFITATDELSSDAQTLAQGSVEQSSSVAELSSSITNISNQIDLNLQQAIQASSLAQTIQADAEKSSEQMTEMKQAIQEIGEAGKSIEKIIDVIDSIAFQTNILALNAAVEAARAGQHGKGFAVVADEVRTLASKSAEAAKNTNRLIANSIEKSNLGSNISIDTVSSLEKIIGEIKQSNQIITKISESAHIQNETIKQIKAEIDRVARVVQKNSETAQQSAAASEELSGQTTVLKSLLVDFDQNVAC